MFMAVLGAVYADYRRRRLRLADDMRLIGAAAYSIGQRIDVACRCRMRRHRLYSAHAWAHRIYISGDGR